MLLVIFFSSFFYTSSKFAILPLLCTPLSPKLS